MKKEGGRKREQGEDLLLKAFVFVSIPKNTFARGLQTLESGKMFALQEFELKNSLWRLYSK
ncbi:hypothetical protein C7B64_09665 [Merismopedia glauca CCAP 1448/3]|uniref:Uncharacterized protein n=1 Tax=Merismopedia glauca CCAP 1448/3 TaxID=1296344 RepID=A0A2T1C4Z0_9CYAN|nr:hypothetical protein C7B64_09665 [Merismopedia glauca CCAP 1448/3]